MATYSIHGNVKKLNIKLRFSGKLSFWHDSGVYYDIIVSKYYFLIMDSRKIIKAIINR
jgi:hypothetical protein